MKYLLLFLLLPTLLVAQEFEFRQEFDTIPVTISGWQPFIPWLGGLSQSNPALADIDSDSDLDLFVGVFGGDLFFCRNTGTVTAPNLIFETYNFDSIQVDDRLDPTFGDLDADDDIDLLVSTGGDGWLFFYRNIGTLQQAEFVCDDTIWAQGMGPPYCLAPELVDIDADNDLDLFGSNLSTVSFYRNDGTPQNYSFTRVTGVFAGINVQGFASPNFMDIDADSDYDLFVGNEAGKIWFYRNDGTAQQYNFTYVTNNYAGIDVGDYASPEFADLDGDGDFDLLVGRAQEYTTGISPGDVFYYENTGTPQVAHWNLITKNYLSLDVGMTATGAMTDIDADLDIDLFLQHIGDRLSFYQNTGTSDSAAYTWVTDSYQNIAVNDAYLEFGDLDADGDPDLFMGQSAIPGPPSLYYFSNQGTPQAASFTLYSNNYLPGVFSQSSVILSPTLADVDGDNDLDFLISDNSSPCYYFQNNGTPTLPVFVLTSTTWQGLNLDPSATTCFYDIDNDGDLDLFISRWVDWNRLEFYRNEGNAQNPNMVLQTTTFLGDSFPQLYNGIEIVDIDTDGDGDIFLAGCEGGMYFFRNVTGQTPVDPRKRPAGPPIPHLDLVVQPNPGNPVTTITFSLPTPQEASLVVYNLLGAKVATLTSGLQPAGNQVCRWQPSNAASGIYLVRLEAGEESVVRKVVLLK